MMTTSNQSNEKNFFNSNLSGFAYLQRAREVIPKKGEPYYAVTIALQQGKAGESNTLYVDCIVVGGEAQHLVMKYLDKINDRGTKVSARAVMSDFYLDTFIYPKSHERKAGQAGAALKGRLLLLTAMKINGNLINELLGEVVDFGDELWPLAPYVKVEQGDENASKKVQLLQSLGYKFDDQTESFKVSNVNAKQQLQKRRHDYHERTAQNSQQYAKAKNG